MFGDAPPSPLDLKFRLLRIPVRVHPLFWLIMALLGETVFRALGPEYLLIWIGCAFVSILLHEMGHAVAARFYGAWSSITLVAFGGFAAYSPSPHQAWKRLVITAAGPAVNFALVALALGIERTLATSNVIPVIDPLLVVLGVQVKPHLAMVIYFLIVQNLFWGIFNLFPIWPLDGGRMFREVCAMAGSRKADIVTHAVSICVAGFFALWGLLTLTGNQFTGLKKLFFNFEPSLMMTVFFAMFAFENYQMLEQHRRRRQSFYYDDEAPPWGRR